MTKPIGRPILPIMALPRPSRPAAVLADLVGFFRSRQRHDYIAALAAIGITSFIVFAFNHDSKFAREPQIVYVESWPTTRTDAQIETEQRADAAVRAQAVAARRAEFKKLDDGMKAWGL